MRQLSRFVAAVLLVTLAGCAGRPVAPATFARAVATRPDVTIVVTDSGLGGLSVVADLAARLPESGIARKARIVFVNALLDDAIGYNDLKHEADKVRVFDAALAAMEARYRPDLILVACNTLSVFYGRTAHARKGSTETVSIVPMGADLIDRALRETPGATAMIFATKGTIESGAHRGLLLGKGVPDGRIVGQACPRLAGSLERGAHSDETRRFIEGFVKEALARVPEKTGPLVVSLNCTHFGYGRPLWEETFASLGHPGVKVLDPNPLMTDLVLREGAPRRYPATEVTVEVVSKVPIEAGVKASLGSLLRTVSPLTAEALATYRHVPDLFDVTIDPSAVAR